MKLTYIIQSLHNSAGMEKILIQKANYFADINNYEVTIITTDLKHRPVFFHLSEKIKLIDLDINFSEYENYNIFKKVFIFLLKQERYRIRLDKVLKSLRGNITITLMSKNITFLYKIKDGSKKLIEYHFSKEGREYFVNSMHWNFFQKYLYFLRGYLEYRCLGKYDKIILLTEEDRKSWGHKLNNLTVIPNSINEFSTKTPDYNSHIVISVGRLSYQKGYDTLIGIWRDIFKRFPNWKLNIFGDGEDKEYLKDIISRYALNGSIFINSPTPYIRDEYFKSSIYVMTSRYEGLPMVLLEAMSCGLPVVSFACKCGPSDVVTSGNDGFLINNGDTELFKDRLCSLMADRDQRKSFGENAQKNIRRFSENIIMNKWNLLFKEM